MGKMALTSGVMIDDMAFSENLQKLINKVYKLLPIREEGQDWVKLLQTTIEELNGMKRLIKDQDSLFFGILCKLQGLFSLTAETDMKIYRRTIFECLGMLDNLKERCL